METVSVIRSEMISAAESMLRQVQSDTTLSHLIQTVQPAIQLSDKIPIFSEYNSYNLLHRHALSNKEAISISVLKEERRVDLVFGSNQHCWETFLLPDNDYGFRSNRASSPTVHIPIREIEINGLSNEFGVQTTDGIYLSCTNPLTKYLHELLGKFDYKASEEDIHLVQMLLFIMCNDTVLSVADADSTPEQINHVLENMLERQHHEFSTSTLDKLWTKINKNELFKKILTTHHTLYRPGDWSRVSE